MVTAKDFESLQTLDGDTHAFLHRYLDMVLAYEAKNRVPRTHYMSVPCQLNLQVMIKEMRNRGFRVEAVGESLLIYTWQKA